MLSALIDDSDKLILLVCHDDLNTTTCTNIDLGVDYIQGKEKINEVVETGDHSLVHIKPRTSITVLYAIFSTLLVVPFFTTSMYVSHIQDYANRYDSVLIFQAIMLQF